MVLLWRRMVPEKNGVNTFYFISPTDHSNKNNKSWIKQKRHLKKTLKGGANKVEWLGTLELEEQLGSEYTEAFLAS